MSVRRANSGLGKKRKGSPSSRRTSRRRLAVETLESRQLLAARVLISEFLADSDTSIHDENGHREDWIELFNDGDEPASLAGWYLTDDAQNLTKWRLPAITVEPRRFQLIFASGNNRDDPDAPLHASFKLTQEGEYLALVEPDGRTIRSAFAPGYRPQVTDISYGLPQAFEQVSLVPERASATAFIPTTANGGDQLGTAWTTTEFDDAAWFSGQTGLGYETRTGFEGLIGIDVRDAMYRASGSAYLRIPFDVTDPAEYSTLRLRMKYDDGYTAYLNGVLVAQRNTPESLTSRSVATDQRDDAEALEFEDIDLTQFISRLQPGQNVLAIHGLNFSAVNDDFLIFPELIALLPGEIEAGPPLYFSEPSPGAPNGAGVTDIGPMVLDVVHTPLSPAADEPLHVTARVVAGEAGVVEVRLQPRINFGRARAPTLMFDDGAHGDGAAGDGVYGGDIPAGIGQPGQLLRYTIAVVDQSNNVTTWPRHVDPFDTEQCFGALIADPSVSSNLPIVNLVVQDLTAAGTDAGSRGAIYYNGELYDNIQIDIHGQSTRGFAKKSYDVDFPRDHRFQPLPTALHRVKDINLLTNYADKSKLRNTLAYETYGDVGHATHFAFPVRVQVNGQFYGVYDLVEDGDDDLLERNRLDPLGAMYKMYDTLYSITGGAEKKTRREEGKGDLLALQSALRQTGPALTQFVWDNIDIPGMVNFLAGMIITGSVDCCHKNYYAYRDTRGTGEWTYIAWDLDLSFGRNWTPTRTYFDDGLYSNNPLYIGRGNLLVDVLLADPAFNAMYLRRVRTLMEELLQSSDVTEADRRYEQRIDELIAQIGGDAELDNERWGVWGTFPTWEEQLDILRNQYLPLRRGFLFNDLGDARGPIPPTQSLDATLSFDAVEYAPASGNRAEQYIAVRNPNRFSVDVSGWRLEGSVEHDFKPGTVIPAGGTLYVTPSARAFRARGTGPSGGQALFVQEGFDRFLPRAGGELRILDKSGREAASFDYEGEPSAPQRFLRVSEINYHPHDPAAGSPFDDNDFEFLELANIGSEPLDVSGVRFIDGIEFNFSTAAAQDLAPGERIVVVNNEAAFRARYGDAPRVAGEYLGNLNNAGEHLLLVDGDGQAILDFSYSDDWLPATDGNGSTLVCVDLGAPVLAWGTREQWRASGVVGGTPGRDDRLPAGDADGDGDVDLDDLFAVRNHFGRPEGGPGDADHDGDVDLDDLNAVRNHFGEGMASISETLASAATIANRIAAGKAPSAPSVDLMAVDRVLEATIWLRYQDAVKTAPSLPMRPKFTRSR